MLLGIYLGMTSYSLYSFLSFAYNSKKRLQEEGYTIIKRKSKPTIWTILGYILVFVPIANLQIPYYTHNDKNYEVLKKSLLEKGDIIKLEDSNKQIYEEESYTNEDEQIIERIKQDSRINYTPMHKEDDDTELFTSIYKEEENE